MIIRSIYIEDLPLRVRWMNNPKVYTSMHYETPITLEKTIEWYNKNIDNRRRVDVCFVQNDEIVSFGGLTSIDSMLKKAELYIFVNPENHHAGIGTMTTKMLCKYGFEELGLHKIYLFVNEDNIPAINVYKKCGFILEGKHRDELLVRGEYKEMHYYGLLKGELNT